MTPVYDKLAIVDIETTGSTPGIDRIIEVGVILIDNNQVTGQWQTFLNPERRLPPEITSLTGISVSDLATAPLFAEVAEELTQLLSGRTFVAHFARFDYSFLKAEFMKLGLQWQSPQLCSVKLSRFLFPHEKRHGLDAVINRFNLTCNHRHRALGDAEMVWRFLEQLRHLFSDQHLQAVLPQLKRSATTPALIPETEVAALPECPGIYIFKDAADYPLYVGKSVNIRQRVKSHWYDDLHSGRELQLKATAAHVTYQTTAGEIGALLLESKLIKDLKPLYNRMSREKETRCGVWIKPDKKGYLTLHFERTHTIAAEQVKNLLTLTTSKKKLQERLTQLATEYSLCWQLLGLEKSKTGCFGYHLGSCKGACVGKEPIEDYNRRLELAVQTMKIKHWPFETPIYINEYNELTGQAEYHVFDRWCWLGSYTELPSAQVSTATVGNFDQDIYHIMQHMFRRYKTEIHPISL